MKLGNKPRGPDWTRTSDFLSASEALSQTELQAHEKQYSSPSIGSLLGDCRLQRDQEYSEDLEEPTTILILHIYQLYCFAPAVGLEPTTSRLTV